MMDAPTLDHLNQAVREITFDARVERKQLTKSVSRLYLRTDKGTAPLKLRPNGEDFVLGPAHALGLDPKIRIAIAQVAARWMRANGMAA